MTRGGRRENAGRRSLAPGEKRVTLSIRVSPKTVEKVAALRKSGVSIGELIDGIFENYSPEK